MTTLKEAILDKHREGPICPNCHDQREVRVHVRGNEFRLVPCPICTDSLFMTDKEGADDVGC